MMAVKYNVIARGNPGDPDAPEKYYPSVKSSGRLELRALSKQIAEISTVSSVDTLAVLEALLTLIPRELAAGNIIELGDFGSFRLRIQSEGENTPEDVSAHNIKKVKPLFSPGKEFKQVLANTEFNKAAT
jgi:predicted histone-like DNA-binding protein